jgi:hypothetical protein
MKIFVERNHNVVFENERKAAELCRKRLLQCLFHMQIYLLVTVYLRLVKTYSSANFIAIFFFYGHQSLFESKVVDYTVKKGLRFSRPQPGCHLPNSLWLGREGTGQDEENR